MRPNIILALVGILLFFLPLIPLDKFQILFLEHPNITTAEYLPPSIWLLSMIICISLALVLSILLNKTRALLLCEKIITKFWSIDERYFLAICLALIGLKTFLIARYCFHFRPHMVDELTQTFQSKIFAAGLFTGEYQDYLGFFVNQNYVYHNGNWSSQYPPGHALFLSFNYLLGFKWLVQLFLVIATSYFIYATSKLIYNQLVARVSLLLLIVCPFFLVMMSSYMNHSTAIFGLSGFTFYILRYLKDISSYNLPLASLFCAWAFITRPFSAFLYSLAFALPTILKIVRNKDYKLTFFAVLIFGAISSIWATYNLHSTGDPFLSGYIKTWGVLHGFGFHETPWGRDFTLTRGLINQLLNLTFSNLYTFESLIPATLPLAIYLIINQKFSREELILLSVPIFYITGHVFYWHTDFYLGSRFLFSLLIIFIPLSAKAIITIYNKFQNLNFGYLPGSLIIKSIFFILLSYYVTYGLPHRLGIYAYGQSSFKVNLLDKLKNESEQKKIVFIKVSWGARALSRLRGAGISAALSQKAYEKLDLCFLDEISKANHPTLLLEKLIVDQLKLKIPIVKLALNRDTSSKFYSPPNISNQCQDEIQYDLQGEFTIYASHFLLNDPIITQDSNLIVAIDLRDQNQLLINKYFGRQIYYFDGKTLTKADENPY